MFITPAYAQAAGGGALGGGLLGLLPFVAIFAIMYFLLIRPQQQRLKQHRELVANVRRKDTVVTGGGIVGKIVKVVDDDEIEVEIADGVRVRVMKSTLADVRTKGEPVAAKK